MAALGGGLVVIAEPSLLPRRAACRSRTTLPHRESVILSGTARSRLQGQRFHSIVLRSIRGRSPRKKGRTACSSSAVGDVDGEERNLGRIERKSSKGVLAAAVVTVALATGNRVLHKLALIPLKNYPFFLALFTTFGYVMVYFTILYFRYRAGNVTERMLSLPKRPYAVLGFLETISAVSGMAATAVLPGPLIPILSQTFLVWQLLLSYLVLGRRYRFNQVVGCLLVSAGVVTTVMSGTGPRVSLKGTEIFWTLLMINSFLFQAADIVYKEIIFERTRKKLKGRSVDIFVVNSFASGFQAIFTCLLLPLLTQLWGIPLAQLPTYVKHGAACFLNTGSLSQGCEGAPLLPILFILVNMGFNVSLLHLVKISSGVASCLASAFSVPLAIFVFTLPLPYAGLPSTLPASFLAGAAILVSGLLLYSSSPPPPPSTAPCLGPA
ncbi:protein CLT1, chloroplastic-like [Wolffia australiana]